MKWFRTRDPSGGSSKCWWTGTGVLSLLLIGIPAEPATDPCHLASEQEGLLFPVERVDPDWRCRLGPIVNSSTTVGVIGPVQTPIAQGFYEYLLDRPPVIASLVQRLGIANFQASAKGPNQFWVNDGDGTQGLLTMVHDDQTTRIYHIDGCHEGTLFPLVRAKAVVFMKIRPVLTQERQAAVETTLVSYIRLDDRILSALFYILRPLVGGAVTRKIVRGFEVTNQLSTTIAQDPDRVAQEATSPPLFTPDELESLKTQLQSMRRPMPPPQPPHPAP